MHFQNRYFGMCISFVFIWFCVKCCGARKFSHCEIICIVAFCRSSEVPRTTVFFLFLNNIETYIIENVFLYFFYLYPIIYYRTK